MGRGLVCVAVVVSALAGAESALAGTLAKVDTEYRYTEPAESSTNNDVRLYYCGSGGVCSGDPSDPGNYFLISEGVVAPAPGSSGCSAWSSAYTQCPAAGIGAWRVELSAGNDVLQVQICCGSMIVPVVAFGGAGDDSLSVVMGSQMAVLDGGPGEDTLVGAGGGDDLRGGADNDVLHGGSGDDLLDGGFGSDVVEGGTGVLDIATYADRGERVTVNLGGTNANDGSASDGAPGARDDVGSDVEGVTGGSGDDLLTAADASAALRGGAGDDTLIGGASGDLVDGGPDADFINPAAGFDSVLGGAGVDEVDVRDDAEDTVDCGPDADLARVDAIDTVVNCDPAPAALPPSPVVERVVETRTIVLPGRLLFGLDYGFTSTRRSTTLRELVIDVEQGARVTARCRTRGGRRCRRTRDFAKVAAGRVRLRRFEGRPLPIGSRLQIRTTKDGMIGVVKTLTVRRRRAPSVKTLCLPPGATSPSDC